MTTIRTMQLNIPPGMIDFGIGQPAPALLPWRAMQRAVSHRLEANESALLAYGVEQGDGYFRLALAEFLSQGYGLPVSPDELFITNGASQGLDLICTLFTQAGDTVFVEEPSYFLALRIFADHRLKVVSLPTDAEGLVIEALEEKLTQHRPAFLYTIPTFHNPAGFTLPAARRERLVQLSRQHNFLIVADEVYHLLNFDDPPPSPLGSFAHSETVLSLGSFSKIMAPGLRLGWIQTGPALMERLVGCGLLDSGGGLNPFTSAMVRSALELGAQLEYLEQLKTEYRQRAAVLSQALRRHFGQQASFVEPKGGFFIWLRLPERVDTQALLPVARRQQVGLQPGINFSGRQGLRNYARLCFALYDPPQLEEGVSRLAAAVAAYLS